MTHPKEQASGTVAGIAAGLTKAQRELLLHHNATVQRLAPPGLGRGSGARYSYARRLMPELFAAVWCGDCHHYRLTPLGLAVRARILGEQP